MEFLKLEKSLNTISSPDVQQKILEEMVGLYKGSIPESAKGLHWLDYAQSEFEIKYLNTLDKLLKIYSRKSDFTTLHSLARQSMAIVPKNEVAYRWKIKTYKQNGLIISTKKNCWKLIKLKKSMIIEWNCWSILKESKKRKKML